MSIKEKTLTYYDLERIAKALQEHIEAQEKGDAEEGYDNESAIKEIGLTKHTIRELLEIVPQDHGIVRCIPGLYESKK
jgi:hypothetical protein